MRVWLVSSLALLLACVPERSTRPDRRDEDERAACEELGFLCTTDSCTDEMAHARRLAAAQRLAASAGGGEDPMSAAAAYCERTHGLRPPWWSERPRPRSP